MHSEVLLYLVVDLFLQLAQALGCQFRFEYIRKLYRNLHYTGGITLQHVRSGGVHFFSLAAGKHGSKEISQWWQVVSNTVLNSTGPGVEPKTFGIDSYIFNRYANPLVWSGAGLVKCLKFSIFKMFFYMFWPLSFL